MTHLETEISDSDTTQDGVRVPSAELSAKAQDGIYELNKILAFEFLVKSENDRSRV